MLLSMSRWIWSNFDVLATTVTSIASSSVSSSNPYDTKAVFLSLKLSWSGSECKILTGAADMSSSEISVILVNALVSATLAYTFYSCFSFLSIIMKKVKIFEKIKNYK